MALQLQNLLKRLKAIEAQIADVEARLPAHSVKPPIMHQLLDLEDERDRLLAEIAKLRTTEGSDQPGERF